MRKRITFRADETAIDAAKRQAVLRGTTLSVEFAAWLASYAIELPADAARAAIRNLRTKLDTSGLKLSRDEMNER